MEIVGLSPFYMDKLKGDRKMSLETLARIAILLYIQTTYYLPSISYEENIIVKMFYYNRNHCNGSNKYARIR